MTDKFTTIKNFNLFPIIPMSENKKPIVTWSDPNTHINNMDEAIEKYPNVKTWATITGEKSQVMVIDIDNKTKGQNGHESLKEILTTLSKEDNQIIKNTLMVRTPNNGMHLYFKYKEGLKTTANVIPGVDIRTDGGIIIAPDSFVKRKDGKYAFYEANKKTGDIKEMPDALFDYLVSKLKETPKEETKKDQKKNSIDKFYEQVGEGKRDETLFRYACRMRNIIKDEDELYQMIYMYNKKYMNPPLTDKEVQEKINSALKYESDDQELQQDGKGIYKIWYKKEGKDEEGNEIFTEMKTYLTDFGILEAKILRNIDTDDQSINLKIKNSLGKETTINANARELFNDLKIFRTALGIDYNFLGKKIEQLIQLKKWIVKYFIVDDIQNYKITGIRKINGEYVLVTNAGILYKDGTWDTTIKADNILHNIDFTDIDPLTKEEATKLAGYLFTFNSKTVVYNTLGCAVSQMLNTYVRESVKDNLPVLFDIGESNAGKTKAQNIIKLLFNNTNGSFGFNVTTAYAIQKAMGETYLPIFVDEIKPSKDGLNKKKQLGQLIRTATEDHFNLKGTQSQNYKTYETYSTLILTGEDGTEETAAINRTNTVRYARINFNDIGKESINFLCNSSEGQLLLRKLSKHLYLHVLNEWNPKILEQRYDEVKNNIGYNLDSLKDDRMQKTAIYTILGLEILDDVFLKLGVDLTLNAFSPLLASMYINENLIEELNDGHEETLAEYEKILQDIDHIAGNVDVGIKLKEDFDYRTIDENNLAIIIPNIWDKLERYYKTNKSECIPLTRNMFTKSLRMSKYFIDYKPVKFTSFVEANDGSTYATKKAKRAFILNIEALKELDLENLIEEDEPKEGKIIQIRPEYIQEDFDKDIF